MRHPHVPPFIPQVGADVAAEEERLVRTRRDLHAHPELGFEEVRTSAIVRERLAELGIPYLAGVAGTGVVGLIEGRAAPPGGNGASREPRVRPTLLLRADMDALPLQEENTDPFASRVPGKMHACGHDGHTAILLSTAAVLLRRIDRLAGNVKLVFQPAEEDPGGAQPMIEAGVLREPHVDAAIGLHLWTQLPAGTVGLSSGPLMASADEFTIEIRGRGGHAAAPHTCIDPIVAAAHVITALQTIVSRSVDPLESAVVTVARVEAGGSAYNIIPEKATLRGTARAFSPAVRAAYPERIERVVRGVCQALGAEHAFEWKAYYPPVINDPAITSVVARESRRLLGEDRVFEDIRSMGAEDMAFYLREVPGCFFFFGAANFAKDAAYPHHNPRFRIDEDVLAPAVELLARCAESALGMLAAAGAERG
ncbi:MAG: amidohydrolase [Gemmatimonadetes bacterium]|nr:amidohydrolase [Gemmatimonadota bacterium]